MSSSEIAGIVSRGKPTVSKHIKAKCSHHIDLCQYSCRKTIDVDWFDDRLVLPDGHHVYTLAAVADFRSAMENCRLFLTKNDEIGIAPARAHEGDVVCLIKGAISPCLLRQVSEKHWSLVSGDCYLSVFSRWMERNPHGRLQCACNGYFQRRGMTGLEEFIIC